MRLDLAPAWRLAGRSVVSITDQACVGTTAFLTSAFIGRTLGADDLGTYGLIAAATLTVFQISNACVLEAFSVHGSRRTGGEAAAYLAFVAALNSFSVLVVTVAAGAVVALLAAWSVLEVGSAAAAAAGLVYANVFCAQQLIRRHLYMAERPAAALAQSAAFLLATVGAFATLAVTGSSSLPAVYAAMAGCGTAVCLAEAPSLRRQMLRPSPRQVRRFAREHVLYGRWILATIPVLAVCFQGYFFLVALMLSQRDVGYLKAAETFIGPFAQVSTGLSMLLIPMIARRVDDMPAGTQRGVLGRMLLVLVAGAAVYSALVLAFGENLLILIFGPDLAGASVLLPPICFIPLALAAAVPAGVALTARGRSDLKLLAYSLTATASFVAGVPLILAFGVTGAAVGLGASWAALAISQWALLFRLWRRTA